MGVVGLVSFLNRLQGGSRPVNVLDEIRKSGRKDPLIVIDLLTMICSLSGPVDEQIYGCRNQFAWTHASKFCDRLIGAGARLVFFIDGKVQEGKYKLWIQRQERVYAECLKKLDNIPGQFEGKDSGKIPGNVTKHAFVSALIAAARKKGILITTYDVECDREIASFAMRHDALAVFTGDSDFLIYEGKWRVWSSSDLHLESMRTNEWNKYVLRNALQLECNQMPFFAAIAGNDHFKRQLAGKWPFHRVAHMVSELNLRLGITEITVELCEKIFGKQDQALRDSFEDGVMLYDLNIAVKKTDVPPEIRHFPNYAVCILQNIPGSIRLPCLDLREAEYSQIALKIYRRQVGLLFRHRPVVFGKTYKSQVFIKPNHHTPYKIVAVPPKYPPSDMDVPRPEKLYSLDADASSPLVMPKLKLLCWLVSDTLSADQIFYINPSYLLDVLTLYFLVENNLLDIVTADIILIVIHDCLNNAIPSKMPLQRPRKPNVQTSFLYIHFYSMIYFCAEIVGLRSELDSFFLCKFDGVYFNAIVDLLRYDFCSMESTVGSLDNLRLYARISKVSDDATNPTAIPKCLEQGEPK